MSVEELDRWGFRLRAFWCRRRSGPSIRSWLSAGSVARIGIGYVKGANDFFHVRPSAARELGIPGEVLRVSVRSNRDLTADDVNEDVARSWIAEDRPVLLLDLAGAAAVPRSVKAYLESAAGRKARGTYKCRHREPWFAVPDVRTPHAFLSIMSGRGPTLVGNSAGVTCTNSIHAVEFLNGANPMG